MKIYNIKPLDKALGASIQAKIDRLSKPLGSLGSLEQLAVQVGQIQGTLTPRFSQPYNIVFCADHGIVEEGISKSPKEVTWQVVYNMLSGGAGVCYLARQHGIAMHIVDVGVDYDFVDDTRLVHRKIARGTQSYLHGYAMSRSEFEEAIQVGEQEVLSVHQEGCNVISFGEMGITNTAASAVWMSLLAGIPLIDCVGRGSGLDDEGVQHKYRILKQSIDNYSGDGTALDIIRYFGGLEMVATVGAMLQAAELGMTILVDGFIMTACMLAASKLNPLVLEYAVFGHQGDEAGHARLLNYLEAKPLLNLGLRLGEGSGSVCAYPIVQSAVLMLSEMASFERAGVVEYVFDEPQK